MRVHDNTKGQTTLLHVTQTGSARKLSRIADKSGRLARLLEAAGDRADDSHGVCHSNPEDQE